MKPDFFEAFPPLWNQFERSLKEMYMEQILAGALEKADPTAHVLSNVYEKLGWAFWRFRGIGAPWTTQLEEVFFENHYYELKRNLYYYDGLDALVADNLQGKAGALVQKAHFWGKRGRAAALYTQALKPCLDARKGERIEAFRELARELSKPVSYQTRLPLDGSDGDLISLTLEFQSKCRKNHVGEGMDGYTYSFHGRSYRDYESLWTDDTETIAPGVFLGKDRYGGRVLGTRCNIPTFDYADREWDSRVLEFLFLDGANVQLLVVRGGYKIASLTFYENLVSADCRLRPLFERLGWPTGGIDWKKY